MELSIRVALFILLKINFWVKKGINTLNRLNRFLGLRKE